MSGPSFLDALASVCQISDINLSVEARLPARFKLCFVVLTQ